MDVLTEQGVVRESDIFTLLFPRGYTPKPEETRAARTTKGAEGDANFPRGDTDATSPRSRIPPLKMLSPKTPRSLLSSFPMTAYDCTVVWTFVCDWVKAQVAMEAPAVIPGLGSVTLRTQALKIRIPFIEPDRAFMAKHGLRMDPSLIPLQGVAAKSTRVLTTGNNTLPDQAVPVLRHSSDVLAFSYMEMAACCGRSMDAAKAKECLQVVIQKIGESMRHCERVEVDLGAGVVVCMNRVMESHMLPRHTNIQPPIEYEVRTGESIVKRTLQSIAATSPTAKKTKASFLTSSELGCAIQVNPAATESSSRPSDLFVFDMGSNSRRTRLTVLPQSTQSVSASPRTQQLQARLKKQSSLENDSNDPQKSVFANGFEPLFDTISRTFCVEPDLNLAALLPSNRIAANYTPSSASLVIVRSKGSSGMVQSAGLIFVEDILPFDVFEESCDSRKERVQSRHGGGEVPDHFDSERRYFAYLEDSNRLMDSRWLAPLSNLLVERIIASAIKYLNSNPTGYMREILSAAQQEFVDNYNFSVKKSILDYLMLRKASRNRLSIVYGTPPHTKLPPRWKWGDSTSDNGCMGDLKALAAAATVIPRKHHRQSATKASEVQENSLQRKKRRRKYVKSKLVSSLMIVDPGIRALHFMWYDFASTILLIKLPSVEELSGSLKPMDIQDFENEQFKHGRMIRAQVVMTWYNRAKDLFEGTLMKPRRSHSGVQVDARTKHRLDSVAVQMSLQVRSLVFSSVRAYVSFFELFRRSAQSGGSEDESNVTSPVYSGLLLSLTLQNGRVQFKTPLVEVPSLLLNVLHSLPQLFYNLNRIETQFSEPLPIDSSDSPFLWNTSSQEDEFVVATVQIREIIETNLVELKALLLDYEDFSSVFRHVQSTQSQVDAVFTDIATCQREVERIREMSKRLITTTRTRRYLRLFTVDCGDVNHALLGAFNEWVARLLAAFAERTAHMNGELRQQYKDVAARIAKRPVDLYELVDAEGYIDYLKTSKLQELQQNVQEIKDRMRFLLFQQENATKVDEDAVVEHQCAAGDDDNSSPRNEKASPRRRGAKSDEFHVSIELLSSTAKTIRWRAHIERLLGDAEASLVGERARIEAIFLARRNRFQAEIEEFDAEVKSFSKKGDLRHAATYVVQLGKMKDVLQSFRKQMESIVAEESKLQWKPTDFNKLDDIAEEMEPYEQLWRTAREFRELSSRWLRSNVYELQAQEGVHGLQQMLATITSVSNVLQINSAATAITAELIKKQMLDFRENTRLVAAILNPCMQERHLTEVSAVIGLTLDREEPLTLLKLLENGAFDHLARIVEISENATMEAEVEKALRSVETEWQDVCFKFKPPKEQTGRRASKFTNAVSSDLILLKSSVDEIKVLVEDHLLRLQTLQCLRHAATFATEISSWLRFLHEIHEVADLLVTNERLWRQLEPLFTAHIIEEAAQETKWFVFADRLYRSVVATVRKHSLCVNLVERTSDASLDTRVIDLATPSSQDGSTAALLCDLQACHTYLERVRDNVCVGLEHRREAFPRFYFLSDADLVAVLACSGSPRKEGSTGSSNAGSSQLWHYLHQCFPGIDHVLINTSSATQEISALMSADGEQVPVGSPIPTAEVPISVWLSKLETAMHTILQACVRAAISDLARKEFRKWCLLWPEQVVTTTIQFAWSLQGEQANMKPNQRDIQAAWLIIVEDLKEKALAVSRELKAASTPSSKRALSNVIIVLQHLRDASMQIHDDVDVPSDVAPVEDSSTTQAQVSMCWFSQPRFYYTANTLGMVVMSFAPLSYGFEYLGNTSRSMVVTPLTLRCFQHLAYNASALARGSYVQGPPGVGKHTTCQALSRLCGRLWILPNAQQHHVTGIEGVAKFLKGVTSCGAWLCMDGLHKLPDLHELSLIGTICSQIMDSLTARHTHCSVLGTRLRMRSGVHFLVMASSVNPARSIVVDAARDRLRSFFRPVDVPVPEINKLAEFYLENAMMLTSTALGKLIHAAWIAFRRHIGLLMYERVDGSPYPISHSMLNFRALKQIVQRAVDTCTDERQRINISHGFSPGLMVTASNITEIPNEMAREIERMEHRFVCLALRESIGALVPVSSLEMVEFVLRDFASNSLARELRVSRSFLTTGRGVGISGLLASSRPSSREDARWTPEEVMETMLQQTESEWLEVLGEDLSQKVIQLFRSLSTRRVTVVCGDVSTGKTLLYKVLARVLSRLHKENHPIVASEPTVRPTRHIVISPRALVRHQLLRVSNDPARSSHTILQNISRDVKSRALQDPHQQMWLVMDGDLSSLWAEDFLQAVGSTELVDEESEGDDQGLLLSTGKRLVLPKSMRVLLETTTLADVTPSFLTKVGIVNVGAKSLYTSRSNAMWRGLYKVWKLQHKEEFHTLDQELFALLDMLVDETVDSCLTFANTQFQAIRHPCVSTWRIRSFFALLHSSFRQSWVKLCGMVSTKQRKTAMHCLFLQSLVWGIGHTYEVSEQHRFHTFLRELIIQGPRSADSSLKRVVLLYFPSGTMGTSKALSGMGATKQTLEITASTGASGSSTSANAANVAKETIYNFAFSVELGMKWFRWPEYYDQWLHTYMQPMTDGSSAIPSVRSGVEQLPMPEDSSDDGSTLRLNGMSDGSMNHVFVRTPATAAAMCLLHQLMKCGYSVLLTGPRDVGKTTCSQAWIKLLTSLAHSESAESANIGVGGPLQASDGSAITNNASFCTESIYVNAGVKASNVLEQLSTYMEHQRIRRSSSVQSVESKPDAGVVHHKLTSSTIVFIDDLHCASCNDPDDSGMELLRGIIEHHQLVHPRTNAPMPCSGLFLFGAMQTGGHLASQTPTGRERLRLAQRFVPLSLRPMSDSDLTSVCSSIISTLAPLTSDASPNGVSELSYSATQEATQLQSVLVKATIKLFRVLCSDKWALTSTPSSSAASSQFTSAMAFQPSKAHYLFHQRDILEVLKGVCCDTRVSLSFAEKPLIARLWCHESARVFGDRLSNKRDTDKFYQLLHTLVLTQFSLTSEVFVPPFLDMSALSGPTKHQWLQRHLHFTFIGESSGAGMIDGYREVNELHKVELSIERSMMAMYRANVLTESLEFVLCTYVIHHVMRLSRVLRRSGQHVLCVGQRGRKMLSITRLAVFICRKTVHVFSAPRKHRDAIAVWTTFLRSVVLQCLRQPDESSVLVIKDAWLVCPEIYATIDQLLGGYRLFSDIISYDDLDETVLQTLRNEAERDHEGSDASSRTMYDPMKLLNSKGAVLNYLYVCLRRRLQVVLLFALPQGTIESSQTSWKLAEILWRYTHLQRSCTINYMGEWPEDSLVTVAQKCLTTQFGSEKDRLTQLSQATVQVYMETQRAMGEWTGMCPDSTDLNQHQDDHELSHSSTGPPLPSSELVNIASLSVVPSLLVEQISLFTTYYPRLQRDVDTTKSRFERGLEFIERTDQILALEQSQQQMLEPEMAKRTIATRRMSGNLEREKLTANKLTKALEMETALVESQRQRLQQVELEYDDLVRETRLVFEEKQASITVFQVAVAEGNGVDEGEVSTVDDSVEGQGQPPHLREAATRRLRRSMIRTFIALAQVPTSLRQLAECYGLIFGIEPVEACDELDPDEIVMDYWESTTARMRDVAFWNVLASFDVRKYMNEKILARILPVCTSPDFDVALLSAVHEVAGVLCDWVKACALYSRDFLLAEPKYLQLCNERELFRAAVAQMNARQAEMDLQANTTSNVNAMRTLTEQERKDIEAKLKDTTSTLQMALSVWKVLESTKEKWRKKYEDATTKSVHMMGDVILATALVAYCPALTAQARVALRQRWCAVLNRFYIMHSSLPPRLLSDVFLVESRTIMRWQVDGIPEGDAVAIENAVIVTRSYLTPVLVDPTGVASKWVSQQEVNSGLTVVSAVSTSNPTLWEHVTLSVRKKATLMITDLTASVVEAILPVLQAKRRARFDYVNRDLSSASTGISTGFGTSGASAGAAGATPTFRRVSSVGMALGVSTHGLDDSIVPTGQHGNHRCWFEIPKTAPDRKDSFTMASQNTILECGSDSLRVYLVYSQPSDELPEWLTALASQLILIRFAFSAAHVQERAQQAIVEARHETSRLMEIRTLRLDLIACDEQIETMENEMLDFFSVEDPVLVFSDTTKALKIVGNRSALHTLESSKNDSIIKIHQHLLYFARYDVLVQRIIDVALTLRYVKALPSAEGAHFSIERLWSWVGLALRRSSSTSSAAEVAAIMTVFARQSIQASESEVLVQLFEFMFAFNVYSRRELAMTSLLPFEAPRKITATVNPTPEYELLARLVVLLQCDDDTPTLKKVFAAVTSKLLALRPECIPSHHWRALCYLAEKVPPLRTLITQLSEASKQNREVWRESFDLAHIDSSEGSSWQPAPVCDGLMRVCIVAALNRRWILREIDTFAARELTWAGDFEVEEELEVPLSQGEEKTGESLMTKMATSLDAVVRAAMHALPMPHSLKELWRSYSKTNEPIVVVCYPAADFLHELTELASDVVTTVEMSCNEASSVEAFEKQLIVAMQKGHWVALMNLDSKPHWRNCIARILADTSKYEVHSDFRLWISILVSPTIRQPVSESIEGVRKCLNPRYTFFRSLAHVITLAKQHRIINTQLQPENEFLHQPLKRLVVFHAALSSSDMFAFSLWKQQAGVHDDRFFMALNALAQFTPQEDNGKPRTTCTVWNSIQITVLNVYGADVTTVQDRLLLSCCADLLFHAEAIDPVLMEAITKTAVDVAQVIKQFDAMSWLSICENAHTFWSRGLSTTVESVAISQRQQLLSRLHQILEYHGAFMLSSRGGKMSVVEGPKAARATAGGSGAGPQAGGLIDLALDSITRFATELDGISFDERELDERYPRDYKHPLHQVLRYEITQMQQIQRSIREDIAAIQAGLFGQEPLRQAISIAFARIIQGVTPSPWLSLLQPHSHAEVVQLESFRTTVLRRLRYFSTWLEKGRPSRLELDKFQSCEAVFQVIHQHFVRNFVGTTVCGVDCLKVQRIFEDRQHVSLPARDETFYLAGVRLFGNLQAEILSGSVSVSQAATILERKRSQMPQTTRDSSEIRVDGTPVVLEVTASCLSSQPKAQDTIGSTRHLVPPVLSSPHRTSTNPAWSGYLCPIFRSSACTSSKAELLPVLGRLGSVEANITIVSGVSLPELTLSGTVLVIDPVNRDGL